MKVYIISLSAGVLVGVIYSLLHVRSPAPPLVALVGLAGILIGEQVIPIGKQVLAGASISSAWQRPWARSTFSECCRVIIPLNRKTWQRTQWRNSHDRTGRFTRSYSAWGSLYDA
jgi:XapX domain-containing protein